LGHPVHYKVDVSRRCTRRPRPQNRSKFASIPGVTSLPRDVTVVPRPPPKFSADDPQVAVVAPLDKARDGSGVDGPTDTRLVRLESRVAVAEKSTRALLVEVVRLHSALDAAMRSAEEEKAARQDAEARTTAAADALTKVGDGRVTVTT